MQQIDGIEREAGGPVELAIIWLHGLGADAGDFVPIVNELELPTGVRFVFPNAPERPVTINGGMVMRAWYDIAGFGPGIADDVDGIAASVAIVDQLVEREIGRGIPAEKILLAGFSQGGAVVLHAGLGSDLGLGGVIGLSTYLPAPERLTGREAIASGTPVFMAHGSHDPVIPLELARQSADLLIEAGVAVDWSVYPMAHEVSRPEIQAISDWLRRFQDRS